MIPGKKAEIKISGSPMDFNDETMTTTDNVIYVIDDETKSVWDYKTDPVVKVDAVIVTTGYSVVKLSGQIAFDADPVGVVTVSGKYVTLTSVATANEYDYSLENDFEDITPFKSEYKKKKVVMSGMTGSIGKFRELDNYFMDQLISGDPVVIEFYVDEVEDPVRVFALLDSDEIAAAANGIQSEKISFVSTTKMII